MPDPKPDPDHRGSSQARSVAATFRRQCESGGILWHRDVFRYFRDKAMQWQGATYV